MMRSGKLLLLFTLISMNSTNAFAIKKSDNLTIEKIYSIRSYLYKKLDPDQKSPLAFAEAFDGQRKKKIYILYKISDAKKDNIGKRKVIPFELEGSYLVYKGYPVGYLSKLPDRSLGLDSLCSLEFKNSCQIRQLKNRLKIKISPESFSKMVTRTSTQPIEEKPIAGSMPTCSPPHCCGEPDGCDLVRDSWGGVSFKEACNAHDRCYYTVGSNVDNCNRDFRKGLLDDCKKGTLICVNGFCTRDPIRESACVNWALTKVLAVVATEKAFFEKAQKRQKSYEKKINAPLDQGHLPRPANAQRKTSKVELARKPMSGISAV